MMNTRKRYQQAWRDWRLFIHGQKQMEPADQVAVMAAASLGMRLIGDRYACPFHWLTWREGVSLKTFCKVLPWAYEVGE